MAIKVAFIGAGSVGFTRKLLRDILCVPELADTEFSLHDVDKENLGRVAKLCRRDIRANKLPAKVRTSVDRRRALAGADYVFNVVRIGGVEAFGKDIDIPLKYGIDQCVGDTLAPGGIFYAQRNIPQLLEFCRDIREVAAADCLLMNYANPMAMNTWAAIKHGRVRTVGLCHGIEHGWMQIADVLGADDWRDVEIVCAGINHQTWYTKIIYRGREVGSDELLEAFERHPTYSVRREKASGFSGRGYPP
ncbi:MAG: alpha-glucosidase/alpha-galactosidase, partial [Phycisphaerae bacterium]